MMIKAILTFELRFRQDTDNIEKEKEEAKRLMEQFASYHGWGSLIAGIQPKIEVVND